MRTGMEISSLDSGSTAVSLDSETVSASVWAVAGRLETKAGRLITPDMHAEIMEGAQAHRENMAAVDPEYWPMCQTWLYQERWETALEEKAERERDRQAAEQSPQAQHDREVLERAEFTRAFKEAQRIEPGLTVEEFAALSTANARRLFTL